MTTPRERDKPSSPWSTPLLSRSSSNASVEMTGTTSPAPDRPIFLGIDVGTTSARAGLFDEDGKLLGSASSPIQIWKEGDYIEQSSTDIWHAICAAVKSACSLADVDGKEVSSMGFAATCSLVAVDADGSPVTVSLSSDTRRNVIVWMDHRAVKQAERINSSNSPVLQYCGGALSPEMQPPKLLWVKENLQESWSMAFRWMDLSDWLSYRATGDDTRSLCTTVCKWTYLGHAHMQQISEKDSRDMEACGWDDDFWEEIGLGDLVEGHHAKIGRSVAFPGHPLGSGLTIDAAKELGLEVGTPVGTSLIDAHAGGVGVMESLPVSALKAAENDNESICRRMVLVCGTSTCHMAVSQTKVFIPGVWGPFWSGMEPFQESTEEYFPSSFPLPQQKSKPKEKKVEGSQTIQQKKNLSWTPSMIQCLVDCMLEIVNNQGKRSDNGVKKNTYAVVAEEMNKKGFTVNKLHVENKLKAMKGQYHMAELTLKQSGFSFNHITKCVDAEDDVWERWILHNKDAKPLRTKGLKYYKECELMFGKDYATGGANFVANDYDHRSQTGENDHETINLDEFDCPTTDVLISPIPPESSKGEPKKTTPTTNKCRRSRVSNEDPGLPTLEKMANVVASIAESLVRPSKKKLHKALKAIPNMEKKNILHAYNLIGKDDNLVENFFGLDEGDRREWVMDQLGLE